MRDADLIHAAVAFMDADIAYMKLVERVLDLRDKDKNQITAAELRELKAARQKKATLEEQMYRVWERHAVEY